MSFLEKMGASDGDADGGGGDRVRAAFGSRLSTTLSKSMGARPSVFNRDDDSGSEDGDDDSTTRVVFTGKCMSSSMIWLLCV